MAHQQSLVAIINKEHKPRNRWPKCDQCDSATINGLYCHETGCPNTNKRYDAESNSWIKQRKCFDCGYIVDADDPCCSAEMTD